MLISAKGIHLNILNHIGPEGRQSHYIYYSETIEQFIRQQGEWIATWIKESKNEKFGKNENRRDRKYKYRRQNGRIYGQVRCINTLVHI